MRLLDNHLDVLLVQHEHWKLVCLAGIPYLELKHPSGIYVTIEERPSYCDRGDWIAKITDPGPFFIDGADFWPRYYFDLAVAFSEIDAFITRRVKK